MKLQYEFIEKVFSDPARYINTSDKIGLGYYLMVYSQENTYVFYTGIKGFTLPWNNISANIQVTDIVDLEGNVQKQLVCIDKDVYYINNAIVSKYYKNKKYHIKITKRGEGVKIVTPVEIEDFIKTLDLVKIT